jgi:hypothetical protein
MERDFRVVSAEEQCLLSQEATSASAFLSMVLCEISLMEVNLYVSKHLTAVSIPGQHVLSKTRHR